MRSLGGPPHPTLLSQDEIGVGENLDKFSGFIRLGESVLAGMVELGQRAEESWSKAGFGIHCHSRVDCWPLLESLDCWLNRLRLGLRLLPHWLRLHKDTSFSGWSRSWLLAAAGSQGSRRPVLVSKENKLARGRGCDEEQQPDGCHPGLLRLSQWVCGEPLL